MQFFGLFQLLLLMLVEFDCLAFCHCAKDMLKCGDKYQ
jgi:hypothetical protein